MNLAELKTIEKLTSPDDSIKYAFQDVDGHKFESIYFTLSTRNKIANFICISSQAGCAMACKFCATGYGGFFENLTPEKMMSEVEIINEEVIKSDPEKDNTFNIVLMGMGEPLMNYDNVVEFCFKAREKYSKLNRIFISTVGVSNRIHQLANLDLSLNLKLYLSLHSPYNEERKKIMPITKKYNIESVIDACKEFAQKTETRVKATYLLLKNVNDTEQHARDFAKLLDPRYFEAQVQLYNTTPGIPYERVSEECAHRFRNIISENGIETVIRISKGRDVNGGCGQFVKSVNNKTACRVLSGTFSKEKMGAAEYLSS